MGLAGVVGSTTIGEASPACNKVEQPSDFARRAILVRERLEGLVPGANLAHPPDAGVDHAQWLNFPNWPNWNNWGNGWVKFPNWANRY
jgi:hypothetical protein